MDSDGDTQSSKSQHKPAILAFEEYSTNDTRKENEGTKALSNCELNVLSQSPLPKFCTADLISAAGSGAKILLRIAKESADVFGPLKSVLGGVCAIYDQYEVCPRPPVSRVTRF